MNIPVFDLHCDTALALLGDKFYADGNLKKNGFHIDLERAGKLAGYTQCFACFTTPWEKLPGGMTIEDLFERELSVILRELNANQDVIKQVYTAEEVEENLANHIMFLKLMLNKTECKSCAIYRNIYFLKKIR